MRYSNLELESAKKKSATGTAMSQWVDPDFKQGPAPMKSSSKTNQPAALNHKPPQKSKVVKGAKQSAPKGKSHRTTASTHQQDAANSSDWVNNFSPTTASDLAVHPKKIEEVRGWLAGFWESPMPPGASRILLLTGPTGSGKTATIRALAVDLGADLAEWTNPLTSAYEKPIDDDSADSRPKRGDAFFMPSAQARFSDFLSRTRCRSVVFVGQRKHSLGRKIILLEDLPTLCYRDSTQFFNLLSQYNAKPGLQNPLVIILSDSNISSETSARRVLPERIIGQLGIQRVEFNPIAPSLMQKALARISEKLIQVGKIEQSFSQAQLAAIIANADGDIRAALNMLQFGHEQRQDCSASSGGSLLKRGASSTKSRKRKGASKSTAATTSNSSASKFSSFLSAQGQSKESSLDLFHALGKILHSKRDQSKPCVPLPMRFRLHQHRFEAECEHPDEIVERSPLDPSLFTLFLHENYIDFYRDDNCLEILSVCADFFGFADTLMADWAAAAQGNAKEKAAAICASAVVHCNDIASLLAANGSDGRAPQGKGWRPLRKPEWLAVWREHQSACLKAQDLFAPFVWSIGGDLQFDTLPALARLPNLSLQSAEQCTFLQDSIEFRRHSTFRRQRAYDARSLDQFEDYYPVDSHVTMHPSESASQRPFGLGSQASSGDLKELTHCGAPEKGEDINEIFIEMSDDEQLV